MVDKEPKSDLMNLYFSKFCNKIKHLFHNGIEVTHNKIKYLLKFCSLSFPVDSVCRSILQNRIQFNGYFGCSWCYQVREYIKSVKGIRYIRDQDGQLRFHESYLKNVEAAKRGRIMEGVKGYSSLSKLPFIDMVWSFPYEYMHGLLLGVVLQLKNLWKNKKSNF